LFVSQQVEGRNSTCSVVRKLYRLGRTGWVYWIGYVSRSRFRRGRYEDLFEVCCQFLDERVSGDGIDGYGPDHVNRKGKEEERELHDEHCASGDYEYEQLRTDAEWNDGCIACYHNGGAGCCRE
jgi:hypothetical protein